MDAIKINNNILLKYCTLTKKYYDISNSINLVKLDTEVTL